MMENKPISEEYKEFWSTAVEIAEDDYKKYPLGNLEVKREKVEKHLIGMLEMYQIRYGEFNIRKIIVRFLKNDKSFNSLSEEDRNHVICTILPKEE